MDSEGTVWLADFLQDLGGLKYVYLRDLGGPKVFFTGFKWVINMVFLRDLS